MQLRNKYYPYPVLVEGGEYYSNSTFTTSLRQQMDGYNIRLSIKSELTDKLLMEMVTLGDVVFVHHIECPQTCYRRVYTTKDELFEIVLRDNEVNGIVQICSFLVANRDIEKYTNDSFSADYRGWKFNIDKGCIMAVGRQYNLRINKIKDDLSDTSSIFSIVKDMDPTHTVMRVDLNNEKITIVLPGKTHSQYDMIKDYLDTQSVVHSMIIIPALVYTFSALKEAGDQLYEYDNKRWFRALKKACKGIEVEIDPEGIKNLDALVVSQQLLQSPLMNGVEYLALGGNNYED